MLATQGWKKIADENEPLTPIDRLVDQFSMPRASAGADLCAIRLEFSKILQYAIMYISLATSEYRAVWWRLFHAPCACEWANMLILAELLFSLPASNGKVERTFSQLKVIKSDKRTSLNNDTLDDLLTIVTSNCSMKDFNPDKAIDLWWQSKTRRPNQTGRHCSSTTQNATSDDDSDPETDSDMLEEWGPFSFW